MVPLRSPASARPIAGGRPGYTPAVEPSTANRKEATVNLTYATREPAWRCGAVRSAFARMAVIVPEEVRKSATSRRMLPKPEGALR
jgi:hypothetical protein